LSPVLSHQERILLSQNLLRHTILAAMPLGPVVVVSRSKNVRGFAAGIGANTLIENHHDLNDAVRQGIDWAQAHGASSALILPLDLPLLTTTALEKLVEPDCQQTPTITIAPCRHRQGTNALVLTPPHLIPPQFGSHSFARHRQLAQQAGVKPTICHSPQLAFDLDTPEDWLEFTALESKHKWGLLTIEPIKTMS
jgi:2-phospho-L-lactate/phosphoenolpyruvate guanylyltransferase